MAKMALFPGPPKGRDWQIGFKESCYLPRVEIGKLGSKKAANLNSLI